MTTRPNYPRNKDQLIKEMDVRMKLGDIKRMHDVRERLSPQWWEPALVVILFATALGLLASLYQYTQLHDTVLNKWMFFWFGMMILMIVFYFQILLLRIYQFRRMSQVIMKGLEDVRERMDRIEEKLEERPSMIAADESASTREEATQKAD